ncbi:MAG: type II toxin-antitoxin system RelB/DinJ family antitoxin [Phascolarctobacterium sp.]|nr:type II toxin-antitoxin system RelB/DinJ family antitoxin [Candidatus Phascolarctobacterium equi]
MSTTMVQFRVEEDLKREATALYEKIGLDLPSAMRMFLKQSLLANGLPFPAVLTKPSFKSEDEMTVAEFNAMLQEATRQMRDGEIMDSADAFKLIRERVAHA